MKIISDYILDLKPYPITMNAMEKTLESPTLKEVLEKNLLRGEVDPIFKDDDHLRYFTVNPVNTAFSTTDLVLNKEKEELSMNIIFDNNEFAESLVKGIESGTLVFEMRGVSNNKGEDFRLICFDIVPVEKSRRR